MNKKNPENFDDDCTRVAESFKQNKEDNIQEKNPYTTAEGVKMGRTSRITPKVMPEKVLSPSSLDKGVIFIEGVNILKLPKEFIDFYFLEVIKARKVADLYKEQGRKEVIEDELEYLEWVLEHKNRGYTKEFYENNLQARLNKIKEKD